MTGAQTATNPVFKPGQEPHSPGPWTAKDGHIIASNGEEIGEIWRTEAWSSGEPIEHEDQANLALIVQAPELLARAERAEAHRDAVWTQRRLALLLIWRLHEQAVLSEGQCCRALQMQRVEFRAMCDEFAAEVVLPPSSEQATPVWPSGCREPVLCEASGVCEWSGCPHGAELVLPTPDRAALREKPAADGEEA